MNTNRRKSTWTESHLDFLKNIRINVIYNDADINRTIIETTHSAEFNCMKGVNNIWTAPTSKGTFAGI